MKACIARFFSVPRPNTRMIILHQIFLQENPDVTMSYVQFTRLCHELTSVRTIRMGGAEISLIKLGHVIVDRAFRSISMKNTISIDEKPIILKNYMVRSMRVLKEKRGPLYKSMLYGFKMNPFYLIAAVSMNGLLSFRLFDHPVHKEDFEGFIAHVSITFTKKTTQFLLYDNATFHNICEECQDILSENGFEITQTPPCGCFLDPIEEFFGIFDTLFRNKYQHEIVQSGYFNPLTRAQIKDLIIQSIHESNRSLKKQFMRALLF